MSLDVTIVGGGHNGLVAACYLARAGLRVEVFERRSFVGGAAMTEELWPGFRFSTCAHMVHSLHPKILCDLKLVERGLAFCPRKAGIAIRTDGACFGPPDLDVPGNLAYAGRLTPGERQGVWTRTKRSSNTCEGSSPPTAWDLPPRSKISAAGHRA